MAASQRAARISRFMLTYAGQGAGKKEQLDLSEAIREGLLLLSVSLPMNMHLRTELPAHVRSFLGDATHIEQILTNLALNACEAIGEHGGDYYCGHQCGDRCGDPEIDLFPSGLGPEGNKLRLFFDFLNTGSGNGHGKPGKDLRTLFFFHTSSLTRHWGSPLSWDWCGHTKVQSRLKANSAKAPPSGCSSPCRLRKYCIQRGRCTRFRARRCPGFWSLW